MDPKKIGYRKYDFKTPLNLLNPLKTINSYFMSINNDVVVRDFLFIYRSTKKERVFQSKNQFHFDFYRYNTYTYTNVYIRVTQKYMEKLNV